MIESQCLTCGKKLSRKDATHCIDHRVIKYTPINDVQPLCCKCNTMKGNKTGD